MPMQSCVHGLSTFLHYRRDLQLSSRMQFSECCYPSSLQNASLWIFDSARKYCIKKSKYLCNKFRLESCLFCRSLKIKSEVRVTYWERGLNQMLFSMQHHVEEHKPRVTMHISLSKCVFFFQKWKCVGYVQQASHHAKYVVYTKYKCNSSGATH